MERTDNREKTVPNDHHSTISGIFHVPPIRENNTTLNHYNNNNNYNNGINKSNHEQKKTFRNILPQILAVSAKNGLLLVYGMTLGLPTIAIPALYSTSVSNSPSFSRYVDPIQLNKEQISWFSSINLICVPLGCILSGTLTRIFGRKYCMIVLTCPFILAWMIFYFSSTVTELYLALIIIGLCGGLLEAPVLTYIAEITEPHLRGMLSAISSTTVLIGCISQFILGNFLHWRTVVLVNMVIPVGTLISLLFIPESPHWLISKNRIADAEKSLCWLRGWVKPEVVQQELSMLTNSIDLNRENIIMKKNKKFYSFYAKRTFVLPYFIITAAFFFGNFGGMNTLQTHSVQIFETLGSPIDGYMCTLILGISQLMGAVICSSLVHWTGKRSITIISMAGSSVCFFVVAAYAYVKHYNEEIILNVTWIPLVFLNTAAFMSHVSIKQLPWILIGEFFPLNIRAQASGISCSSYYITSFIVNKSYFMVIDCIDLPGIFLVFATVSIIGCVTLYTILPETEGVSLEDIQEHFVNKSKTFVTTIERTDKNNKKKTWDTTNPLSELNHTEN